MIITNKILKRTQSKMFRQMNNLSKLKNWTKLLTKQPINLRKKNFSSIKNKKIFLKMKKIS